MIGHPAKVDLILRNEGNHPITVRIYLPLSKFRGVLDAAVRQDVEVIHVDGSDVSVAANCMLVFDTKLNRHRPSPRISYALLTLSDNAACLYEGTQYHLQRLSKSITKQEEDNAVTAGPQTCVGIIEEYVRLDSALRPMLGEQGNPPLILAGPRQLTAMFRQVNSYPLLLSDGISGQIERAQPESLRKLSWRIISRISV